VRGAAAFAILTFTRLNPAFLILGVAELGVVANRQDHNAAQGWHETRIASVADPGRAMPTLIHRRVRDAQAGKNPTVIRRLASGWAVLGDAQFLRGYSLLLADPVVSDLNALDEAGRHRFLRDMSILGDALLEVTGARLINYEILGNTDRALHAHLFPRYDAEPADRRPLPVWLYERHVRDSRPFDIERDGPLQAAVAAAIDRRLLRQ
jgi:diadenosine tetraphosphate (Ap4A) HIT family hydrolase